LNEAAPRSRLARWWRPAVLALLWASPLPLLRIDAVRSGVVAGAEWMRASGAVAIAAYAAVYLAGSLVAAPTLLMSSVAGFAYGPVVGVAVAAPVCATAAALVCFVARRVGFAKPGAPSQGHENARVATLLRMLAHADLKTAALLRATPLVPQNVLSYAFAFSKLSVLQVFVATLVGLFPMTCVHVYVGSIVAHASELLESGTLPGPTWMPYVVGALALVTLPTSFYVLRSAARERAQAAAA
jgi:uncharacterized membrane protein YdjX (TVP38/TMEM64 family)